MRDRTSIPLGAWPVKYMGSKRALLSNGLGHLLLEEAPRFRRVVDLFAGSAAVSWHVAQNVDRKVWSNDLQQYSALLANSVLLRRKRLLGDELVATWLDKGRKHFLANRNWSKIRRVESQQCMERVVEQARAYCEDYADAGGTVWSSYGGHYFSPSQALAIDILYRLLPDGEPERSVCHSALIMSASRCAAAPGHTAQPFQPIASQVEYLRRSWNRDIFHVCEKDLRWIGSVAARRVGKATVESANTVAQQLTEGDLVFVDPPYSNVQYSRFYHVLETIATGKCTGVSGVGRYPRMEERPQSEYSKRTGSRAALTDLLESLAASGCGVILTFPLGASSNGLSGRAVTSIAKRFFRIERQKVAGRFSSMGGNNLKRSAWNDSMELILRLDPL